MTISPEAVQAALDACESCWDTGAGNRNAMQAALDAAFPIMLREVADKLTGEQTGGYTYLGNVQAIMNELADNYGKGR